MDIIIETPKGSPLKYVFDEELKLFRLKKTLAAGLVFPFDFGFIPGTKAEDGAPLDVLVISEFTSFPGCVLDCRIIGCIQAEQGVAKEKTRNDRYLAIPEQSRVYEQITSVEELPGQLMRDIESFFINYITAEGKRLRLLGNLSAAEALVSLQRG